MREILMTILEEEAPCDGCPLASKCKSDRLACLDFMGYISQPQKPLLLNWADGRGINRHPTREVYDLIYDGHERVEAAYKRADGGAVWLIPPAMKEATDRAKKSLMKAMKEDGCNEK